MRELAGRFGLTYTQVYKWKWERDRQESIQMGFIDSKKISEEIMKAKGDLKVFKVEKVYRPKPVLKDATKGEEKNIIE